MELDVGNLQPFTDVFNIWNWEGLIFVVKYEHIEILLLPRLESRLEVECTFVFFTH